MTTRSIAKSEWKKYLDDYSKSIQSIVIELDVESLELGDLIEADWVHLKGMSYDTKDDMLFIFTESLRHFIAHPENLWVIEDNGELRALQIEDSQEVKHIVNVRNASRVRAHQEERSEQHGISP